MLLRQSNRDAVFDLEQGNESPSPQRLDIELGTLLLALQLNIDLIGTEFRTGYAFDGLLQSPLLA